MSAYFIAEIGQNHQGSLELAKQMVDSLVGTGVDAIKTAKRDVSSFPEEWESMPYLNENSFGNTYAEHRRFLELTDDEFVELAYYSRKKGFDFISSFTDISSFDFLYKYVTPRYYKIASSRAVDYDLLTHVANHNVPVILSTGMCDMKDVEMSFKGLRPEVLMQCTSSYPTVPHDINLNVIHTYKNRFDCEVGFSGHHIGIYPDVIAVAMGATFLERHYTLDKGMRGTDHKCSLDQLDIIQLMKRLKGLDKILGSEEKTILYSEASAIKKLRHDLRIRS